MSGKILFSLLAALLLAGISVCLARPGFCAEENEPLAGVAVLEGEAYYWPVLAGEFPEPETRLVALERDLRIISLLAGLDFQPRSREILPESVPVLDQLAELLNANPDLGILITVRPEKIGKPGPDSALAGERAGQVGDYLLSKGIEDSRVSARAGKGAAGTQGRPEEPPVEIAITDQDQNLGQRWLLANKSTDFYAGDEIKTGSGKVKILFSGGAILVLRPGTHVKLLEAGRVRLLRGGLLGILDNLKSEGGFSLVTANAGVSAGNGGFAAAFSNGTSVFNSLRGDLSIHLRAEPDKPLSLPAGKKITVQNGKDPGRPKSMEAGEIRNIQDEFSLKNFDSAQPLFDEDIRKRLERIQPPDREKPLAPRPSAGPPDFPPAGTGAVTPGL